jgi:hypothetical protein
MNGQSLAMPHQLLNWILQRGSQMLAVRLFRLGERYQVSVFSPGQPVPVYAQACDRGPAALRAHAALVADFRDAGWRSVGYR